MRHIFTTSVAALGFFASTAANAATLNLAVGEQAIGQITSDHCSGSGGCIPDGQNAGTVTVKHLSGTTYEVVVNLGANYGIVNTGFDVGVGFDLTGTPTITYTSLTSGFGVFGGSNGGLPPSTQAPQNINNEDGFGNSGISYGLNCTVCQGGSNPFTGVLDFTISGVTDFQTFVSNDGIDTTYMVLDLKNLSAAGLPSSGNTGLTDVTAFGTPTQFSAVPGPFAGAGLPGLMAACAGLIAFGRRRRQRRLIA